jgi:virginiamycin B lyase
MTKRFLFAVVALWIAVFVVFAEQQPAAQGRGGAQAPLPDGAGKELVQTTCSKCHSLALITGGFGYARADWDKVIGSMVALPAADHAAIVSYLAAHFPEKNRPKPVLVPGPVQVSFKEWIAPSLGSRPHDPLATADGAIWWTGMWANVLGRVDPKSGDLKEFPLKTPGSGPHGLTADQDGNIWYTGNSKALVGKLNPKTGEVTEYKMPDPSARDPHTPLFDKNGLLWFTLQQSNMVGTLEPKTGAIKLIPMPTPRSLPYGMVFSSAGDPFIVLFGTNKVASIDARTRAVKEYPLPNAASRPRRIAITSDDVIWYSDYSRGFLGRLDPKTGDVKEYASPSGPKSQPYGITALHDIIWYCETAVAPNTLVRFDPKTAQFQSWVIPAGGGVVRNMMPTRDGDLVIAESGVNRIALVDIK